MEQFVDEMITHIKSMLMSNDEYGNVMANRFLFNSFYSTKDFKSLGRIKYQEDKNLHFKIVDGKILRLLPKHQILTTK